MLRNNMQPKNFSPKKGKGVSMLRKKHGKNHQKRGSTSAGMTDGQISKTDLSRFKMGGQLSPEYPPGAKSVGLVFYKAAIFLFKKSLNFLLVSILSISLKMVCLSSSSKRWPYGYPLLLHDCIPCSRPIVSCGL